jgi:hypothetical protein
MNGEILYQEWKYGEMMWIQVSTTTTLRVPNIIDIEQLHSFAT